MKSTPSMYDMFSGMLKDHIGRAEFVDAFKQVVAQIQKLKLSNEQDIAAMHQHIQSFSDNISKMNAKELAAAKKEALDSVKNDIAQHSNKISLMETKINLLKDGENGEDGKTPTQEELLALITPLIPQVKDGKDAQMDVDAIVAQVLTKVPKGGARMGWGAHPLVIQDTGVTKVKVARQINFTGATVTQSGDGVTTVAITGGASSGFQAPSSGAVDGSNKSFVWATAPKVIVVDQGRAMQKTSSDGTVNWTGTTTTALTVAPTSDIYATA